MLKQQVHDLIEAAFEVYVELGYGMTEEVTKKALKSNLEH